MARQVKEGGRLGENLIAMGLLTADQIAEVINTAPAIPAISKRPASRERNLLNLMLKFMHVEGGETVLDLAERMKLPRRGVQQLIEDAIQQSAFSGAHRRQQRLALSTRYALTEAGRNAAKEALEQSVYLGPAPV